MALRLYQVQLSTKEQDGLMYVVYAKNSTEARDKAIKLAKTEIHCTNISEIDLYEDEI